MLQWLCVSPMSINDFNQRFMDDPLIGKTLSEDSLWLYLNTLKILGCEISRPMASNGYRYELLYQPFGAPLELEDIEVLAEIKQLAEWHMTYDQVLYLDQFFKKTLQLSTLEQRDTAVFDLFKETRSVDYEGCRVLIQELEQVIGQRKLLFITYDSLMKGKESFYFLPELICYQRGVLFLKGSRLGYEQSVLLRVDRIQTFEVADGPELIHEQLMKIQDGVFQVELRLYEVIPLTYVPLGFDEQYHYVEEPGQRPYMSVTIQTRDWFLLKQKLFEMGRAFEIMAPDEFRADVLETLVAMKRHYEEQSPVS